MNLSPSWPLPRWKIKTIGYILEAGGTARSFLTGESYKEPETDPAGAVLSDIYDRVISRRRRSHLKNYPFSREELAEFLTLAGGEAARGDVVFDNYLLEVAAAIVQHLEADE